MDRSRSVLVLALLGLLFGGCGHDKQAMKTVSTLASFELDCPKDELELTVLTTEGARKLAKQIGVTGCGQKVVYLYFVSSDAWIADSAVTPALLQYEETYKEQRAREERAAEQEQRFEEEQSYQRGVNQ
jgi:hypothetical protein